MEAIDQQWPHSAPAFIDVRALSQLDTMLCSLSSVLLKLPAERQQACVSS